MLLNIKGNAAVSKMNSSKRVVTLISYLMLCLSTTLRFCVGLGQILLSPFQVMYLKGRFRMTIAVRRMESSNQRRPLSMASWYYFCFQSMGSNVKLGGFKAYSRRMLKYSWLYL